MASGLNIATRSPEILASCFVSRKSVAICANHGLMSWSYSYEAYHQLLSKRYHLLGLECPLISFDFLFMTTLFHEFPAHLLLDTS